MVQCVDWGLNSFGANMKQVTYSLFASRKRISSNDILSNPEEFVNALKDVFGPGYPLAERAIVKEIKSEFELFSPSKSNSLLDVLENAKSKIAEISENPKIIVK